MSIRQEKYISFQPFDAVTTNPVNREQLRQDKSLYHITITALHIFTTFLTGHSF